MFHTPILFLVFNRPEQTRKVFEIIRAVKPKHLFVAADGPRENVDEDKEQCALTRKIATTVDWDSELHILFRERNLGCGRAVSEAINWFFENVEEGIILEDDCLTDKSFFPFASELLNRYRNVEKVMHISANGLLKPQRTLASLFTSKPSYSFVQYPLIWGWATWKRAWKNYDFNMPDWESGGEKLLEESFPNPKTRIYWKREFDAVFNGELDTWDYQWLYTLLRSHGLSIIPEHNLVRNIGFGNDATHYFEPDDIRIHMQVKPLESNLKHPSHISINKIYNLNLEEEVFGLKCRKGIYNRILDKAKRRLSGK